MRAAEILLNIVIVFDLKVYILHKMTLLFSELGILTRYWKWTEEEI